MVRAFTLLEMALVLAIVITVATVTVIGLRQGSSGGALRRSASRVALDIRRAQNLAFTSLIHQGASVYGFGVYFDAATPNQYILFADVDGNNRYTNSAEDVEVVRLEQGIYVASLIPGSPLVINFRSPEPTTYFWQGPSPPVPVTQPVVISLGSQVDPTLPQRTITINTFGLVDF